MNAHSLSHRADTFVTTDTHAVGKDENKTSEEYNRGHLTLARVRPTDRRAHSRSRVGRAETQETDAEK